MNHRRRIFTAIVAMGLSWPPAAASRLRRRRAVRRLAQAPPAGR